MRRARRAIGTALFAASIISPPVSAAPAVESTNVLIACVSGGDEALRLMKGLLEAADESLPNVPPEEEKYLAAESATGLRMYKTELAANPPDHTPSNKLYAALFSRPLYAAWEARKELRNARLAIQQIGQSEGRAIVYPRNVEAMKLRQAIQAVPSIARYEKALESFSNSPFVTNDVMRVLTANFMLSQELSWYMECRLAKTVSE